MVGAREVLRDPGRVVNQGRKRARGAATRRLPSQALRQRHLEGSAELAHVEQHDNGLHHWCGRSLGA